MKRNTLAKPHPAIEEWSASLNGLTLRGLRTWGEPGAGTVVALHGWLDNAASFVPLMRCLPHFHWLCVDLSGHGKSAHKRTGACEYHAMDWVLEVALVLERLDEFLPLVLSSASEEKRRVHLLGHSLGAGVSSFLASVAPARIERLALLDGIAPLFASPESLVERARTFVREAASPPGNRVFETFDSLVAQRARNGGMAEASARLLMERGHEVVAGGVTAAADANLKRTSPLRFTRPQVESVLRGIECPALLVDFGAATFGRPAHEHEDLLECVNDLRVETLPGGHHLHMDEPTRVATVLDSFFTGAR